METKSKKSRRNGGSAVNNNENLLLDVPKVLTTSPSNSPRSSTISPSKVEGGGLRNILSRASIISPARHSSLRELLRKKRKPAPTFKSDFPTPALARLQKGGFYSCIELEGNVETCPNIGNELHVCTDYCYQHYAPQSGKELLIERAKVAKLHATSQVCRIT